MKAIVQERYGSPDEVLALREVDQPVPGDDEVLVQVRAASINAYEWHFVRGDPKLARADMGFGKPKTRIRGRDFAGVVEKTGAAVTRLRPGDEVYGDLGARNGAFAEYVAVPDTQVDLKPPSLTFEQAAAIPLAGNTALMGIRDVGRVQPGQRVLINGASGGVGPFAVQIAKAYGAEVTAVCSARNVDMARTCGADHVIDYRTQDFTRGGEHYDVVFDLVGNHSLGALRRSLKPGGQVILSGGGVFDGGSIFGPMALMMQGKLMERFGVPVTVLAEKPSTENLTTLRGMAETGELTPVIDRTYPLSDVPTAIAYLEKEHARAKVVITVGSDEIAGPATP
jgi:NADPH:quinone reductase-like Zn-dependent oxidoreductase